MYKQTYQLALSDHLNYLKFFWEFCFQIFCLVDYDYTLSHNCILVPC